MNGLQLTERKGELAMTAPARHTTLRAAAQRLSLRNVDQAATELLNEALARLTLLCYERGDDGAYCNIDAPTGRVLIPLPWGRAGYAKWGLTPSEANVFRLIMLTRQRQGLPLYAYDRSRRAWYLNLSDFPDGRAVIAQLSEWQIGLGEYRQARAKLLSTEVGTGGK